MVYRNELYVNGGSSCFAGQWYLSSDSPSQISAKVKLSILVESFLLFRPALRHILQRLNRNRDKLSISTSYYIVKTSIRQASFFCKIFYPWQKGDSAWISWKKGEILVFVSAQSDIGGLGMVKSMRIGLRGFGVAVGDQELIFSQDHGKGHHKLKAATELLC